MATTRSNSHSFFRTLSRSTMSYITFLKSFFKIYGRLSSLLSRPCSRCPRLLLSASTSFLLFTSRAHRLQYSQPLVDSLPLHAPIPLPLQTPMLYPMDQPLMDPVAYCDPQQQQPCGYGSSDVIQSTFPTPSELLAELAANGLPATGDDFGSDGRSESARKARRRAMAKSVGFIPTDPSVPYPSSIIPD